MSDYLYEAMEKGLRMQEKLLDEMGEVPTHPRGYLIVRESGKGKLYYQAIKTKTSKGWVTKVKNISDSPKKVRALAQKGLNKKLRKIYEKNVKALSVALSKYIPLESEVLMPEKYHEVLVKNGTVKKGKQCAFDPGMHIHATVSGIMVRSKGEVIIANALWHYGIPFVYEEKFPHPSERGDWYYPDFTIHLPDGSVIIWEHLGLLNNIEYCINNAYKLHTYQSSGFVIGKNLILTQDDAEGAIDSAFIYHIIETYILPHFKYVAK